MEFTIFDADSGSLATEVSSERQLANYLQHINSPDFNAEDSPLSVLCKMKAYNNIHPLLNRVLCTLATSAPVERVFSQSGLIMRPHRARMTDTLLETLVLLKCNGQID
jgi:hypothetical protein